ncbi:MAG: membrane protein insertase YidC [Gammaproteobacteria bacterium]|nr:membrane protein insertase YidC [Gammaproteobacteria bacterium]
MDNQRLFLYAGLLFLGLLIWQQWELDYGLPPEPATTPAAGKPAASDQPDSGDEREIPDAPPPTAIVSEEPADKQEAAARDSSGEITVTTDLLRARIDLKGGGFSRVELLNYPVLLDQPDNPIALLDNSKRHWFIAQSGLQSSAGPAPTHHAVYQADRDSYDLPADADTMVVPLSWEQDGVRVSKRFTFTRDSFVVQVDHQLDNNSGAQWSGRQYRQLQRKAVSDDETQQFIYTFIGGVILDEENKYEKIDFEDFGDEEERELTNSWIAIIQHYFLAAWVPAAEEINTLYTKVLSGSPTRYIIGIYSPTLAVPAGSSETFSSSLFVGPKIQDRLKQLADKLHLTVDYGYLTVLAEPLFWLLRKIHDYVGNWGLAIIVVTILIKLVFYKLSELSYRSMARMRKLQPKLQSLKERFGDDRQKLGQATMDLYRKEKINPLGGCLPMIVQIPVFIALYWVLLESVELRQAPFFLWIDDLSVRDPFFVLPLIMGVTMFVQQKLNPTPVDPVQAKIFMMLPFIFTAFFAFFPSGLVLYWACNNVLSIAQQYYITRHVLAEK